MLTAALDCFAHYGLGRHGARPRRRSTTPRPRSTRWTTAQLAGRLEASYYLAFAELLCERFDDVIRHTERGVAVSRASGQGQFVVPMMVGLAHALETRGRLAEAMDTVEGAVEAGRLSGNRQVLSWALVGEGWVAAITGDIERAGRAAEEAVALLGELSDSILTLATHALASLVFLEAGDVERCLAEGRAAGAPDFAAIEPGRAAWLLGVLARAELERGDRRAPRGPPSRAPASCSAGMSLPLMESTVIQAEALLALDDGRSAAGGRAGRGRRGPGRRDRRRGPGRAAARARRARRWPRRATATRALALLKAAEAELAGVRRAPRARRGGARAAQARRARRRAASGAAAARGSRRSAGASARSPSSSRRAGRTARSPPSCS